MVTIEDFATITKRIIARDGFDDYLPTALYPDRNVVVVLEDSPEDGDLESAAVEWAAERAFGNEESLVAFKVDPRHFKVIWRRPGDQEAKVLQRGLPNAAVIESRHARH
jgi:hypothetical protein